jgi:hypothetical protein
MQMPTQQTQTSAMRSIRLNRHPRANARAMKLLAMHRSPKQKGLETMPH